MIAKNYVRFPEALRFQREMFSNGYHNSPRIMRLVEVVFSWATDVPQWFKDAKAKAGALVKHWKKAQITLNFSEAVAIAKRTVGFFYGPRGESWTGRGQVPQWLASLVRAGDSKELYKWEGEREFYSLF